MKRSEKDELFETAMKVVREVVENDGDARSVRSDAYLVLDRFTTAGINATFGKRNKRKPKVTQ